MEGFSDPGGVTLHSPRVRWNLDIVSRGNSLRMLAPLAPAKQQSAGGGEVSTACAAVSIREITVFVHELADV